MSIGKRLYVGNLSYQAREEDVRSLFEGGGFTVDEVHLVDDRDTGRPKGFGFVTVKENGDEAIQYANESQFMGRKLTVSEARPKTGGGGRGGYDRQDRNDRGGRRHDRD